MQQINHNQSVISESRFVARWGSAPADKMTKSLNGVFDCFILFLNEKDMSILSRTSSKLLKKCYFEKRRFDWIDGLSSRFFSIFLRRMLRSPIGVERFSYLEMLKNQYQINIFPHVHTVHYRSSVPLETFINFMPNLTNLKTLRFMEDMGAPVLGHDYLTNIISLENLRFACHLTTDAQLVALSNMTSLKSLSFRNCPRITDQCFSTLSHLTRLNTLEILHCHEIRGAYFFNLANLTELSIDTHQFNIANLSSLIHLRKITLYNVPMAHPNLLHLSHLLSLNHLNIHDHTLGSFDDHSLLDLSCLPCLEQLEISTNYKITDTGLLHLTTLTSLRKLAISHCLKISLAGLARLNNHFHNSLQLDQVGLVSQHVSLTGQISNVGRRVFSSLSKGIGFR